MSTIAEELLILNQTKQKIISAVSASYIENIAPTTFSEYADKVQNIINAYTSTGDLISVSIPEGLSSIRSYAFASMLNLSSVVLPSSTKSIGAYAFYYDPLTSINFPAELTNIGASAFEGAIAVRSYKFQNLDLSQISSPCIFGDKCFKKRSATGTAGPTLTAATLPNVDCTYNVSCFMYALNLLTSFTIPSQQTKQLGGYAFYDSSNIEYVYGGENLTAYGTSEFDGCINLKSIPTNKIKTINSYAFCDCESLSVLNFPELTSVNTYTFSNCSNLKEFNAPNLKSISTYSFSGCRSLSSFNFNSLTSTAGTAYAFAQCSCLTGEAYFNELTSLTATTFASTNGPGVRFSSLHFPKVKTAASSCYLYNGNLSGIYSLKEFDAPALTSTFSYYILYNTTPDGKWQMERVNIPSVKTVNSGAFSKMTHLSSLNLSSCTSFTTPFGTSYNATYKMNALTELHLPSITTIATKSFGSTATQQYTGIVDLYIPNKTQAQVKAMTNYATWYCGSGCTIHASDGDFYYGS